MSWYSSRKLFLSLFNNKKAFNFFFLVFDKKSRKAPPCLSLCHGVFFKHFVLTAKVLVSIVKGIICLNPYGAAQPSQGSSNLDKENNRTKEKKTYRLTKIPFNCIIFILNRFQRVLSKSLKVATWILSWDHLISFFKPFK